MDVFERSAEYDANMNTIFLVEAHRRMPAQFASVTWNKPR